MLKPIYENDVTETPLCKKGLKYQNDKIWRKTSDTYMFLLSVLFPLSILKQIYQVMYYKADIDIVEMRTLSRKLRPPAKASFAPFTNKRERKKGFIQGLLKHHAIGWGRGQNLTFAHDYDYALWEDQKWSLDHSPKDSLNIKGEPKKNYQSFLSITQ